MELRHNREKPLNFLIEDEAFEGVKRIAAKVAEDFKRVSGVAPTFIQKKEEVCGATILCATLGQSPLIDRWVANGTMDVTKIQGKVEVFQKVILENPFYEDQDEHAHPILVIVGSDKRGTIYGMFSLSEYIGVSPLHFWGDVEPIEKETIEIRKDIETVSKEPSVKYRGFFINDEWPCFGNWTFSRYGGFNAKMYDSVFELLLRLKGNYLWPAMWTSSFPLDGPGNLSEELAHVYGVVMGASHHEPCLRASEEWDLVRGLDTKYGNEWNYYTNKEGLLNYWADALKRSGHLEKIIMLGMRGERDSSMLGEGATVKENVDLLKEIILNQRELIEEHVTYDSPLMIALYKEVEEYFYGSEEAEGLKDWEGLEDVICMLCEDNFGFVRSLPTKEMGERKYGMYYHFDYHGGPISYEWMPSTTFQRTKDQMSMAYDYGIREVWVVNVGDLKFNEVPLGFFMALAYDFEKYGTNQPLAVETYTNQWVKSTFPKTASSLQKKIGEVLHGYIGLNSLRRPEALNVGVYHPCHYLESDGILERVEKIERDNEQIYQQLKDKGKKAYYSMIYIPAKASLNLIRMHVYSAKNIHYAKQGKKIANDYADFVTDCLERDKTIMKEFASFQSGKWKGMELEEHIGFTNWNENNCRNPLRVRVEPFHKPRLVVSRKDDERVYHKAYGSPMTLVVDDFLYQGNTQVILEVANDGVGFVDFHLEWEEDVPWLEVHVAKEPHDDLHLDLGVGTGTELNASLYANKDAGTCTERHAGLQPEVGVGTCTERNASMDTETDVETSIERFTGQLMKLDGQGVTVNKQRELILTCLRDQLTQSPLQTRLKIKGKDGTTVVVEVLGKATDTKGLPPRTFLENRGVFTIEANHFAKNVATKKGGFQELINYGRSGSGMKVFPVTSCFTDEVEAPSLVYNLLVESPGEHVVEVWTTPTNSVERNKPLRMLVNEVECRVLPADFNAGCPEDERWCTGVLDNIRKISCVITFEEGVQEIKIQPLEAGLIVERILVYKKGYEMPESYLGPQESYYT